MQVSRPAIAPDSLTGATLTTGPNGTNHASVSTSKFVFALVIAATWFAISLALALSWAEDLARIIGVVPAWLIIGGIALLPGFMNVFQIASLLMRPRGQYAEPECYPPVTILIAAYNEAAHIDRTLGSLRAQRYSGEVEILVIDDGSTDATAQVVRAAALPGLRLIQQETNDGKAAALNRGLAQAEHELIVTIDADSWLHVDALRYLVREYLNGQPQTAAVAGAVFVHNAAANWVTRLQHWDYFHSIAATKRTQSAYGGALVAQGAFSLYRKDILHDIGGWPRCVGEDIVVTWAILQRGLYVRYAEDAVCFTQVPADLPQLVRQRARWARGMFEALFHHPGILIRRRLITFLVGWNLLFLWIDLAYTFGFVPGLVLAAFGHYWLIGPVTLALIPSAALMALVMYRMSARVFAVNGLHIRHDAVALIGYMFGYGLINHPASLRGYAAELLGAPRRWGTK